MILCKLAVEEVKAELGPICWHRTTESTNGGGGGPNVNSSDDASAATSGLKIKLVQQSLQTSLATV